MKCLDKKRIKMKHGEALALNERHMLQMVSISCSLRKSNLRYTRGIAPKPLARSELLATLRPIWPARQSNPRLPAPIAMCLATE